jgi:O-antigen/teichoic acid export membrane protein
LFAEGITLILLGDQWLEIVPLLRILSVFGVVQAVINSIHSLLLALGKTKYVTILTGVAILGLAVSILPLINSYGLIGAAVPFMLIFLSRAVKSLQ